jgi:ferric-dicitrate binding protein FerR (iron transport regulator)
MHALKAVRADGLILVRTRVAGPWGYAMEPGDDVVFHFVAEGRAFVRRPGAETMELQAGELVMFPRGGAHEVVHSTRGKAMPWKRSWLSVMASSTATQRPSR